MPQLFEDLLCIRLSEQTIRTAYSGWHKSTFIKLLFNILAFSACCSYLHIALSVNRANKIAFSRWYFVLLV